MATLLHVVGPQGSGKSFLAELLAAALRARGHAASVIDSELSLYLSNDAIRGRCAAGGYAVVEAEAIAARHADLRGADMVITTSMVRP